MQTEYEAAFLNVDADAVRARLRAAGAQLERPEFLQRRWVFDLPPHMNDRHAFVRVRDEGGVITLTIKKYPDPHSGHPEEAETVVHDFDTAAIIIREIGCPQRSYQENRRELWLLDDAKITFDTWPFMETFIEVEAPTLEAVRAASDKLGFNWDEAHFHGVNKIFKKKYGDHVNLRDVPSITFEMENPFLSGGASPSR